MATKNKLIGTHNGIFHLDDVMAVAILNLLYNKRISVIRTRDVEELKKCDIVVDVGFGKYDHHMKGGNGKRENGVPYSSCGLIWEAFGVFVLKKFECEEEFLKDSFKLISKEIIEPIDKIDNGIDAFSEFNFITDYIPFWTDSNENFNIQFLKALDITTEILERKILSSMCKIESNWVLRKNLNYDDDSFLGDVLDLPTQSINWIEEVVKFNENPNNRPKNFVVFPYPYGGYAAQCVPPSMKEKYNQRIPFPKEWAGLTHELAKISGVETASFCHCNCFFVRAQKKSDIYKMCIIAKKIFNNK